jgi:endonuclease YncB( thermonuclease family)
MRVWGMNGQGYQQVLWITLLIGVGPVSAFSGRVVGVGDGDTLTVLTSDAERRVVRLAGIDAPEVGHGRNNPGQPFGMRSKLKLSELCFGRQVEVELAPGKTYGRFIGYVQCAGKDANFEMLKAGLAWTYPQFNKGARRTPYIEAESSARHSRLGLWSDPTPVAPWLYRQETRAHE